MKILPAFSCFLFAALTYAVPASAGAPRLFFEEAGPFDGACGALKEHDDYKVTKAMRQELLDRHFDFAKLWEAQGTPLVQELERLLKRKYPRSEESVTLTLCQWFSPMSHPLLMRVREYLKATAKDNPGGPQVQLPDSYFVSQVFHELLHRYLDHHFPDVDSDQKSILIKTHSSEKGGVLSHLHVLAIEKAIYLGLGRKKELDEIVGLDSKIPGGTYKRAWEVVDLEGYQKFVDELRSPPTSMDLAVDYKSYFKVSGGCFKVVRLSDGKVIEEHNPRRCGRRFSPNSTFKIPSALMGFETEVLTSEEQVIKWNSQKYDREELNQDQTPRTWMDRSVVWVTQWMMPKINRKRIRKFLNQFEYGNRDFAGGMDKYWLDSTLQISADEQIAFLTNFWNEKWPLTKKTYAATKSIIHIGPLGKTPELVKVELYGKTGTGCLDKACTNAGRMRGWFVGILKTEGDTYVFAANVNDRKPERQPAGPRLRKIVSQALGEMALK